MLTEFLPYYEQELTALRELGQEFGRLYPQLAGALNLDKPGITNPHIERLIQAAAFMNARIQHKLSDDLPEIHNTLLDILLPHVLRPIPSLIITQLEPQADLAKPYSVPRNTLLETDPRKGEVIPFRTCYETSLLPLQISKVNLWSHGEFAPKVNVTKPLRGCLHIQLAGLDKAFDFAKFAPKSLRFYLAGDTLNSFKLYDLLLRTRLEVALTTPDHLPVNFLGADALQPVGFQEEEGLLPYAPHTGLAFRLLTEYFAFPQKFLFFEITGLQPYHWQHIAQQADLYIYLSDVPPLELQHGISISNFALNCTPAINLAERIAEPIIMSGKKTSYPIIPDQRHFADYEIYQIKNVNGIKTTGQKTSYQPLYQLAADTQAVQGVWHITRQPVADNYYAWQLNLAYNNTADALADDEIIQVQLEYCHRHLPQHPIFQHAQVSLQLATASAPVAAIMAITKPTPLLQPPARNAWQWQLLAHLALHQTSLFARQDRAAVLQELLTLQDRMQRNSLQISSMKSLVAGKVNRRMHLGGWPTVLQGLALVLTVDKQAWQASSLWLFAKLLISVFNHFVSINSFVELTVQDEDGQFFYHWAPELGTHAGI